MTAKAPNVLIVMADQMAPAFLPIYGHRSDPRAEHAGAGAAAASSSTAPIATVPCVRRRARRSCRACLPSRTRVYDNAAEFGADIPTFAHCLRLRGYQTILSGKMHFCGPDQLHGFEERLTTDIYPADFGWTPDWDRPEHRPSWYHNMSSVREAGVCVRTNQLDFDDEAAFMAERAIFDIARSKDRAAVSARRLVHPSARPLRRAAALLGPLSRFRHRYARRRAIAPDALDPHSRRLRHVCAMDAEPVTEAQVRDARHAYYGAISYIDDQLGRLMAALRSAGLAEDTIVVLTSDHGEMLGERGLWYKMSFFEGASRVPARRRQSGPLRAAPRRRQRLARRSPADAHRHLRRGSRNRSGSPSTDAASRPISTAAPAMTKRSANISRKARSRRIVMIRRGDVQIHSLARRSRPALRPQP